MKIGECVAAGAVGLALMAVPGMSSSRPNGTGVPVQMVVTVQPDGGRTANLEAGDLKVLQGKIPVPVTGIQPLAGSMAEMQLFILLDDSTRSSSLGLQLPELKEYVSSLPATTQVAIGYMRNGTFALAEPFTADHRQAASVLRLPAAIPGENGSPYFALSDLVKHWPSKQSTGRRAVLMLTDGVDRYYSSQIVDDPYVDAAMHDALRQGVLVYSIYLRGAGLYGRGGWTTTIAQSRLIETGEETGGHAYFQDLTDPVTITPFLKNLQDRFANQYLVTIEVANAKGVQPVKLRTELPGVKVEGPTEIWVR